MNRSEEDIKVKVIVEWLRSIGFSEDELFYGTTLYGHFASDPDGKIIHRYPDILVKRDGRYLYVVEVKKDSNKLTDNDRDQAVQYARMLNPIAPIAIVTNGRESRMYSVRDKSEIVDKGANGYYLNLQDINNKYNDVFEHFISLSPENIRRHCEDQTRKEMATLLGSHEDRNKKFIPELYVASKKLIIALNNFMENNKTVFALIGESASGKTCAMCGMARDLVKERPVLFYRALHLTEDIEKSIASDFNWKFSAHQDEITLLKRLGTFFKDNKLVIFIDAIDEWGYSNKVESLGKFASHIRDGNFKLVISCKSGQWDKFIQRSGIPTALSLEVYSTQKNQIGYYIESFDAEELHGPGGLIRKYRDFYNFHGAFERDVLEECKRSPFLLRVFFEVAYKNKDRCSRLSFSIKEFFDEYYRQAVQERLSDNKDDAVGLLKEVARLLFEKNADSIDIDILRKESDVPVVDKIMPYLYEANILEKVSSGLNAQIGFYFQKFRDYIISFGVRKWNEKTPVQFKEEWAKLELKNVQLESMAFFYPFADTEKKRIIDEPLAANAEIFLNFYEQVLSEHFYNLQDRFPPYTKGPIGFIGALDISKKNLYAFGFRPLPDNEERVKLIPFIGGFPIDDNRIYLMGVTNVRLMAFRTGFNHFDVKKEILQREIIAQLKEIIDNGLLNERHNYYLALEKILGFIVTEQRRLHDVKDYNKLLQYLPISIEAIENGIRYKKASDYYHQRLIDEKIASGAIRGNWHGSRVMYNISLSKEDRELIEKQAREAVLAKDDHGANSVDFKKIERAIKEALTTVKEKTATITETILPDADKIPSRNENPDDFFTKEALLSFVPRFYSLFLEEYKILVETNFPTLKKYFSLYSQMPIHYFIIDNEESDYFFPEICFCKNSDKNEVTLCRDREDVVIDETENILHYKGRKYEIVDRSFRGFSAFPSSPFLDFRVPSEFTVLRGRVYQKIKDELPAVLERLSAIY